MEEDPRCATHGAGGSGREREVKICFSNYFRTGRVEKENELSMAAGRVVDPAIDFCTEGCPLAESRAASAEVPHSSHGSRRSVRVYK